MFHAVSSRQVPVQQVPAVNSPMKTVSATVTEGPADTDLIRGQARGLPMVLERQLQVWSQV